MSRNMRKLRVKLCNATIFSPWGEIFKKYFFQKRTSTSSEMRDLFQRWHLKDIKEINHGFEKSGALQITIWDKWVGSLHFREYYYSFCWYWGLFHFSNLFWLFCSRCSNRKVNKKILKTNQPLQIEIEKVVHKSIHDIITLIICFVL